LEFKAIEIALQIDSLFLQAFRYSRSSSHSRADKTPSADLLGLLGDAESKSHTLVKIEHLLYNKPSFRNLMSSIYFRKDV
jgi:hypothetical protein